MMTAEQARENVQTMRKETPKSARVRLLQIALAGLGNLSPDARVIYAAALREESAK